MSNSKNILLQNKKLWLIPIILAAVIFGLMLLLGDNSTPTPYIYNIH